LSKSLSIAALPAWFGDPLDRLLTGACRVTDLVDDVAFQWAAKPPVTIIFKKSRTPSSHDLHFIAMIIQEQSVYIGMAVEFLLQSLKSRSADEIDVSDPGLIFRLDDNWDVHFHHAIPDETEGQGVLVIFAGEFPSDVAKLDDVDSWFNSDTGEWTPA
jgi:hypothetical protein